MASHRLIRSARPAHAVAGALILAVPSSALALTNSSAAPAPVAATQPTLSPIKPLRLAPNHLAYGHPLTVSGSTSSLAAGTRVALELSNSPRPQANSDWRVVGTTRIGRRGHFRFTAPARESGLLRVVGATTGPTLSLARRVPAVGTTGTTAAATPTVMPSPVRRLSVEARLLVTRKSIGLIGGQHGFVSGKLLPGVGGRRVALQAGTGRGWHTVARTRTGRRGGYTMRFAAPAGSGVALRVRFAGDRLNSRSTAKAGVATVLQPTVASWYSDGGATACGFHAYYGVAHLSLPCGTKVTISNGSRSVVATVDDRGPFVGGRTFDLNQNVAGALGFGGVGTVYVSTQ
ncbi:MAG: septal ring lytic transglycosylase RlpA family protein [Solirubrobacteraceae bacterium]